MFKNKDERTAWVQFAVGALTAVLGNKPSAWAVAASQAAKAADKLLEQYRDRVDDKVAE